MALMVSATGSAGFFLDWVLLKLGLDTMAVRYALAVGLSYLVFLSLVKLWLVFQNRRQAKEAGDSSGSSFDFAIPSGSSGSGGSSGPSGSSFTGGGGSSGGGGASASFIEEGAPQIVVAPVPSGGGSSLLGGGGSGGGGSLDGDEVVAVLVLLMAIGAAFAAAIYLVVQAPAILGEVLLDGTLSAGLYRRLRNLPHHTWLETAVRKTVIPFAAVALLAGTAGHFAQKAAPEARSIGGVWHHFAG